MLIFRSALNSKSSKIYVLMELAKIKCNEDNIFSTSGYSIKSHKQSYNGGNKFQVLGELV